jgi:MFS family permease
MNNINSSHLQINQEYTQSDYDKIKRTPFFYISTMLSMVAVISTVSSPLTLFSVELGLNADKIGILGSLMAFFQVFGILAIPLIGYFGCRIVATAGLFIRYLFLSIFLIVPFYKDDTNTVFLLLFFTMSMFSLCRTISETASVPWTQEFIPKSVRGKIIGRNGLISTPFAILSSYIIKLWLDSQTGLERFYPVFIIAIIIGLIAALFLLGIGGGKPRPKNSSNPNFLKKLIIPLKDKNFQLFLYSSGSQFVVITILAIFLTLFFKIRIGVPTGHLIFMSTLILVGGSFSGIVAGFFVDRYGCRGIRIVLQTGQIFLLLLLPFINSNTPGIDILIGLIFFAFGFLMWGSATIGAIFMLNYVPAAQKESYMTIAYSMDGLIAGTTTIVAGYLVYWLDTNSIQVLGIVLGSYEVLFTLCAIIIASSIIAFAFLQEEGGLGVRDFISQFYVGNPLQALWGISRYNNQTSEEKRQDLAYRFGRARSSIATEELFDALRDPSFDVRYEAILALGHLPQSQNVTKALENMLKYEGFVELQYAALTSLGRLKSQNSSLFIMNFLDHENPLLRSRAIRSLADLKHKNALDQIRDVIKNDKEISCRLAAASALGKFKDRDSLNSLVNLYYDLASEKNPTSGEPRSKVILLAISKILKCEELFSQEWRKEEKFIGFRLPNLIDELAKAIHKLSGEQKYDKSLLENVANELANNNTSLSFDALKSLRPYLEKSSHENTEITLNILDIAEKINSPHRALLILLCIIIKPILTK